MEGNCNEMGIQKFRLSFLLLYTYLDFCQFKVFYTEKWPKVNQFQDKILNERPNKFKNANLKSVEMPFSCSR